jgi:hypothetical protein
MTVALPRGRVIMLGGAHFVVWQAAGNGSDVIALPVRKARKRVRACDVAIDNLGDIGRAGVPIHQVIRAGEPLVIAAIGFKEKGDVTGQLLCRMVHAVARACADRELADKWEAARAHSKRAASERPVNLVAA